MNCIYRNSPLIAIVSLTVLVGSSVSYYHAPLLPALGVMAASMSMTLVFCVLMCVRMSTVNSAKKIPVEDARFIEKTESERNDADLHVHGILAV